jgi:hypothetical protein
VQYEIEVIMQNRIEFKVCLVGQGENFSKFVNAFEKNPLVMLGIDFFYYNDGAITYQIWDLRPYQRFQNQISSYLLHSKAIIFIDANPELINSCKQQAPKGCQFITYNPQMTPQKCLEGLASYVNEKLRFLATGKVGENSIFNKKQVPSEITQIIATNLLSRSI